MIQKDEFNTPNDLTNINTWKTSPPKKKVKRKHRVNSALLYMSFNSRIFSRGPWFCVDCLWRSRLVISAIKHKIWYQALFSFNKIFVVANMLWLRNKCKNTMQRGVSLIYKVVVYAYTFFDNVYIIIISRQSFHMTFEM